MLHHLRKVHGKSIDKKEKETEVTKIAKVSGKTSTQKISIFLKKETIGEVVSKLVALDGFSFNALVNSTFIRSAMSEKGLEFPKNHKQVIQLVKKFSSCIKAELKANFSSMVSSEKRFSISLDEYTSLKNRRFVNVNVHQESKHWNLGLKRISGSLPAEKAVAIVTEKLEEFGLSMVDHIVVLFLMEHL